MAVKGASEYFGKVNVYEPAEGKKRVEVYFRLNETVEGMKGGIAIDLIFNSLMIFFNSISPFSMSSILDFPRQWFLVGKLIIYFGLYVGFILTTNILPNLTSPILQAFW